MMTQRVFEIHVFEVETTLDADGTTPTLIDAARYCIEAAVSLGRGDDLG
jgi:hypothetical protein